jgi:hypothetical protein
MHYSFVRRIVILIKVVWEMTLSPDARREISVSHDHPWKWAGILSFDYVTQVDNFSPSSFSFPPLFFLFCFWRRGRGGGFEKR